jgi:polysaccharide biosynthesis protein PslH
MRVLFITSRLPGRLPRGDQLRAYYQIKHLSARHRITLLSFVDVTDPPESLAELRALCERVILIRQDRTSMILRAMRALVSAQPLQAAIFDSQTLKDQMTTLLATGRYDLAHIQMARLGGLVRQLQTFPCVLDFVDALSLNMYQRARYDRPPAKWLAVIDAMRLAREEHELCSRVTVAAVSTARDRQAIGNFPNLRVVPNGVDLISFPFAKSDEQRTGMVFVGNLNYFPNIDGIQWFVREVLPILKSSCPAARLSLVGNRPSAEIRRMAAREPAIRLIGPVTDVYPYLARAAVAVVPIRAGSGQQLKALEAMAAGTPVVATVTVAAGLGAEDGKTLLVADTGQQMVVQIERILNDSALAVQLTRNARAHIEQHHAWEHTTSELERLWLEAAGQGH